ncbi:MAG: hypothetical protein H6P96_609, partial [Candidatus Aminicenantes bacterium]|nr:hypothetical protein [Candidatus Aminicenantes bacterium]
MNPDGRNRTATGFGDGLATFLRGREDWARDILCRLIGFRSTPGAEAGVQEFLYDLLSRSGFSVRRSPVEESLVSDPDYTPVPGHVDYSGRPNLIVALAGTGGGRSAIVN